MSTIRKHTFLLAVTGGIGTGKSTLCKALCAYAMKRRDVFLWIEYDAVRAEFLHSSPLPAARTLRRKLIDTFGAEIRTPEGGINRSALSRIIFEDPSALSMHNALVEPAIIAEIRRRIKKAAGLVLVEWALIIERGLLRITDYNALLVTCTPQQRLHRILGEGVDTHRLRRRLQLQETPEAALAQLRREQQAHGGNLFTFRNEAPLVLSSVRRLYEVLCDSRIANRNLPMEWSNETAI